MQKCHYIPNININMKEEKRKKSVSVSINHLHPGITTFLHCITEADNARSKAFYFWKTKTKQNKNELFFIIHLQNEKRSRPSAVGFRTTGLGVTYETLEKYLGLRHSVDRKCPTPQFVF